MLNHTTNCDHGEQNLAYWKTVHYDKVEQLWAGLKVILWPFGETAQDNLAIANGSASYWAQGVREDYYRKCNLPS